MLWLLAFHIIFVITWFSALFYLPRLFVYHAMSEDSTSIERFKVMERKLYYGILLPSSILATGFGLALLHLNLKFYIHQPWMIAKLCLVALLWIYQFICLKYLKDFKANNNQHGHVYYRWFNEMSVVILIAVVILVVVKPF